MPLSDEERLTYLRLKKKKAEAESSLYLSNQVSPGTEPGEPSFFQGVKAGITAQEGAGFGYFVGSAIPAGVGAVLGGPIGAALGETARQAAGAVVDPEGTAKKSPLEIGASVAGAGVGQKIGEAAGPFIGRAATKAGETFKSVTDWFASKVGKSFLKASKNLQAYGHEPSKAIVDEKIFATSWDDLVDKSKAARRALGTELDTALNKYPSDKIANIEDVVKPIDEAIEEAAKFPSENASLISRLSGIKDDVLTMVNKIAQEEKGIGIKSANEIKKSLYKVTKYTGSASDDVVANKVKQQVARNIAKKIEEAVPEIKPLNKRFGNIVALENAATNRAVVAERNDLFGLPEMFATGIAGVGGAMGTAAGLLPASGLVLASRGLKSPIGATATMRAVTSLGKTIADSSIPEVATFISRRMGGAVSPGLIEQIIPMLQEIENPPKKVEPEAE